MPSDRAKRRAKDLKTCMLVVLQHWYLNVLLFYIWIMGCHPLISWITYYQISHTLEKFWLGISHKFEGFFFRELWIVTSETVLQGLRLLYKRGHCITCTLSGFDVSILCSIVAIFILLEGISQVFEIIRDFMCIIVVHIFGNTCWTEPWLSSIV